MVIRTMGAAGRTPSAQLDFFFSSFRLLSGARSRITGVGAL